ncbi:hypothetical protein SAMN04488593_1305 [Microbacterium azadirachtae]|nr:hypothetical protein SAMN04488593_1305 [Microbacterium azadirachtae]SEF89739.1 hypothetical protein SAMN04488594_1292 [Microbacterium azadirachtae]SEF91633.1 hypothetical protein SAMN04488592_1302 [Microbacterium azadirachtae]
MNNEINGNVGGAAFPIKRRTIVKGVGWSIPVIAASAAMPLASASGITTLSFAAAVYAASACGTMTATIQAMNGASPSANAAVTVSLPDGLMWPDGTTGPKSFTTNSAGQVSLALKAPANNGTYAIIAAAGATTATASVTVTGSTTTTYVWQNYNNTTSDRSTTYANIPASATPLGNNFFLADGAVWWGNSTNKGGKIVASGVTQAVAFHSDSNGHDADWVTMLVNGTWTSFYGTTGSNGTYATYPAVPATATALQNFYFLDGTTLYYGNTPVLSNVTDAFGSYGGNADYVDVLINGVWYTYNNQNGFTNPLYTNSVVPAGATPLGNQYFLDAGNLCFRNALVTTGVTQAVAFRSPNNNYADALVNGVWKSYRDGSLSETYATVPAGATPLKNHYFLSNGTLSYKNTVVASGVTSAQGYYGGDQGSHADFVNFNQTGTC